MASFYLLGEQVLLYSSKNNVKKQLVWILIMLLLQLAVRLLQCRAVGTTTESLRFGKADGIIKEM